MLEFYIKWNKCLKWLSCLRHNMVHRFVDFNILGYKINEEEVYLKVIHCTIQFHDKNHPYVQWIVEFEGKYVDGQNIYENFVEDEILEYPIYSLYLFEKPLCVKKIDTSLKYKLGEENRIVEYFGEQNDKLEGYEAIIFQ